MPHSVVWAFASKSTEKTPSPLTTIVFYIRHMKWNKEMTKIKTYMAILALVTPTVLGACGGSGSSSNTSKKLEANDISVSVSCGVWRSKAILFSEADCNITYKNKSAASGTIYMMWSWKVGDKSCGVGTAKNPNGDPVDVDVTPNETFTFSTVQSTTCAAGYGEPVATNFDITVRE